MGNILSDNKNDSTNKQMKVVPSDVNICGIRTAFIATMLVFFFPGIKEVSEGQGFFSLHLRGQECTPLK